MGIPLAPGASEPSVEAPGIYVLTLGRNKRLKVSGGNGVIDPTWSPDGSSIAFVSVMAGDGQLYTADAASGMTTQLTFDGPPKSSPSWSHSGKSE
jgi:TolB protein